MSGAHYRVHRYHDDGKNEDPLISILKVIWWIISLPFRLLFGKKFGAYSPKGEALDRGFVRSKWQEIEQLIRLGNPSNHSRAVLEADKLLDHILKGFRAPGMTMADRLKASRNRFSPEGYNAAWKAHKVRNELVHNAQYQLMDYEAKDTINNFKIALNDLVQF